MVARTIVSARGLSFTYQDGTRALKKVDFSLASGEFACIGGPSGSGKTTLGLLAAGLHPEFVAGSIAGKLRTGSPGDIIPIIFQNPETVVFGGTVLSELAFPMESRAVSREEMKRRIADLSGSLSLEAILGENLSSLSGGTRQLVFTGGAVAALPALLVLDEPTSMLDKDNRTRFLDALAKARRKNPGLSAMVLTHDKELAGACDTFYRMERGVLSRVKDAAAALGAGTPLDGPSWRSRIEAGFGQAGSPGNSVKTAMKGMKERNGPLEPGDDVRVALEKVSFTWTVDGGRMVLDRLDAAFQRDKRKVHVLRGANGSGKSTCLSLACGLLEPSSGKVVSTARSALCFQNHDLTFFRDSVEEELASLGLSDNDTLARSMELLGIAGTEKKHPFHLSGGQRSRLAVMLSSLSQAGIVLLDEPTKNLDDESVVKLLEFMGSDMVKDKMFIISTNDSRLGFIDHGGPVLIDGKLGRDQSRVRGEQSGLGKDKNRSSPGGVSG